MAKRRVVSRRKKATRKSSSFDFLSFLRKNFLWVAILVLMPVTVLAYQYNLSNTSSAARRNMFRTQDIKPLQIKCSDQQCTGANDQTCAQTEGKNTGYLCNCVLTGSNDAACNKQGTYKWNCSTKDEGRCPVLPTQAPKTQCRNGDQQTIKCGINPNGSQATCTVCHDGVWGGEEDCPDNGRVARSNCFPQTNQTAPTIVPQQPTSPPDNGGNQGGLSGCTTVNTDQGPGCWCAVGGWQKHYCTNWGKSNQYCGSQDCP